MSVNVSASMRVSTSEMAFEEAFDALAALAYRVAFRILGSRGEAEDVAQETMARAYVHWRKVHGHAEPWVAKVSSNLALGIWRKRRSARNGDGPTAHDSEDGLVVQRMRLVDALETLPRRQRESVVLRYLADLSETEVAVQLGCSVGAVKQHAHRGLTRLRELLGEEMDHVR